MLVFGSKATPKNERVYHKINCIYGKRIKKDNLVRMSLNQAEKRHYKECFYCGGMRGDVRTQNKQIKFWENKYGITLTYHIESDSLFVKTKIGFWKIHINTENGKYLLYHRNSYTNNQSGFHRQNDMKSADSLEKLINYIVAHDKAKEIIMDDYHKLPQRSKKQKKYYRQAERRARTESIKRVEMLFTMLQHENI